MSLKVNIANPSTGSQKLIELDDEKKYRSLWDKRISQEVAGETLGDQFKGYIFKITGGIDKEGFAMKQGVLVNHRVRLLLDGTTGHYVNRRDGDRRRKTVRGCICGPDLAVVNLIIVKKGDAEIAGITDVTHPRRLGPKRASKIRKLFDLSKEDDVRQYVIRRTLPAKEGRPVRTKAPKIQRLVTPEKIRRRKLRLVQKRERFIKAQEQKVRYEKLLQAVRTEQRHAALNRKRAAKVPQDDKEAIAKVKAEFKAKAKERHAKRAAKKKAKIAKLIAGGMTLQQIKEKKAAKKAAYQEQKAKATAEKKWVTGGPHARANPKKKVKPTPRRAPKKAEGKATTSK